MYIGTVDMTKAINLQELIVGSQTLGYRNENLHNLTLGNNIMLKKIDASNSPNLSGALNISGCIRIEEVYLKGTNVTSVNLPSAGSLKKIVYPDSITYITIKNQPLLNHGNLQYGSISNLTELIIENSPNLNSLGLVESCMSNGALQRLRLTGINDYVETTELLHRIANSTLKGIDDFGNLINKPVVKGKIMVNRAYEDDINDLMKAFPDLTIIAENIIAGPFVTMIVKDSDDNLVEGAKVLTGGQTYTTNSEGSVTFKHFGPMTYGVSKSPLLPFNGKADIYSDQTIEVVLNVEDFCNVKWEVNSSIYEEEYLYLKTSEGRTVTIKWGDGSEDRISCSTPTKISHRYSSPGIKSIELWNNRAIDLFFTSTDKESQWHLGKIVNLTNCKKVSSKNLDNVFAGCTLLEAVTEELNYAGITSANNIFNGCINMISAPKLWEMVTLGTNGYLSCTKYEHYGEVPKLWGGPVTYTFNYTLPADAPNTVIDVKCDNHFGIFKSPGVITVKVLRSVATPIEFYGEGVMKYQTTLNLNDDTGYFHEFEFEPPLWI